MHGLPFSAPESIVVAKQLSSLPRKKSTHAFARGEIPNSTTLIIRLPPHVESKIEQLKRYMLLCLISMAVEEFQFKIARSKDLPLSWFELVLRPEKFREHLKTLETNPNGTIKTAS